MIGAWTPGVWQTAAFEDGEQIIRNNDDFIICSLAEGLPGDGEIEANAALIAAAPCLYEVLHALMGGDKKLTVGIGGNPNYVEQFVTKARTALARARNEDGEEGKQ